MSDSYTIVLWCADKLRFTSFAAAHLLSEGLLVANQGRIDDIPVRVGVANAQRWPIFSREVSTRGVLRSFRPRVDTFERRAFMLTFGSGGVDGRGSRLGDDTPVLRAANLVRAIEDVSLDAEPKPDVIALFSSVAQLGTGVEAGEAGDHAPRPTRSGVDLRSLADTCQRIVTALNHLPVCPYFRA